MTGECAGQPALRGEHHGQHRQRPLAHRQPHGGDRLDDSRDRGRPARTAQSCGSSPLGTTVTGPPVRSRSGAAAASLTAVSAIRRAMSGVAPGRQDGRQPELPPAGSARSPPPASPGPAPPAPRPRRTASPTPACTCTTSKSPRRSAFSIGREGIGLLAISAGIGMPKRCTGTGNVRPAIRRGSGVAVITSGSRPRLLPPGQVVDLHLDAAEAGHEAVGDVRDPHRPHPPPAAVPTAPCDMLARCRTLCRLLPRPSRRRGAAHLRHHGQARRAGPPGGAGGGHRRRGGSGRRPSCGPTGGWVSVGSPSCTPPPTALGVSPVELLGLRRFRVWPSDPTPPPAAGRPPRLADADVADVAGRLAEILAEERAAVLTRYDANGGYGHPDHVAVHRIAAAAAELAGTPVLLEATVPRDRLLAWPRAGEPAAAARRAGSIWRPGQHAYSRVGGHHPLHRRPRAGPARDGRRCGRTRSQATADRVRARWACSPGCRRRCSAGCSAGSGTGSRRPVPRSHRSVFDAPDGRRRASTVG